MKKEISFAGRTAILHNGEKCAKLFIGESTLPVKLADRINETPEIDVTDISKNGTFASVRMFHALDNSELLGVVCDAITEVYETDIVVTNATTAPIV